MSCLSCGHKNRAGARFCEACGEPLARVCHACGTELSPTARFCGGCGQAVGELQRAGPQTPSGAPDELAETVGAPPEATEGERKQVTVMFVDIVGSMVLAEALDSERWRGLVDRFFAVTSKAVHGVGGTIDKFTGDGAMAIFGAPISQEDHARRACLAALEVHASLAPLAGALAGEGVAFAVRVGLNSGEVIVGEIGDEGQMDYAAVGYAVSLAQRIESLAPAGSTALSAASGALVAGEFELHELGAFDVKGSSVPQRVFELVGRTASRDRVEAAGARGVLSPFVGREREQAALEAALESAIEGAGQVVGLVGEPGVGKSRLAHEFIARCVAEGIAVQRVRALAHCREVPLLPILELMRSALGVDAVDDQAFARGRIAESLQALDPSLAEDLPLLFDFLGVTDPERPAPRLDPEARQRQLLSVVRRFVHARSRLRPAVTLIEDLHWLDDASGVYLAELVRASAGTRTLVILTYRPEYAAGILRGSHCEQLALRPLGQSAVGKLLGSLLGDDRSLVGLSELIAARAVGNPFFCEELVQALVQSGHLVGERGDHRLTQALDEIVLPASVHATLTARIDRLAQREKELLQTASVIGYQVSEPLLGAIAGLSESELNDTLYSLVSAELLSERMHVAGVEYAFKHPLTQEVAYHSQLSDRRRQVHREVASAIERLDHETLDERAALLAQHWEAAGDSLAAARFNRRAAAWVGLSDISQGLAHWRKVGELTETLPDSPETSALTLRAHIAQLNYGWRLGISEQEAAAHYEAGRELARRSGDRVNLLRITAQYANVQGLAGHVEAYDELSEEVNRLSVEIGDPGRRIGALGMAAYARWVRGRLGEALALAEEGIALGAEDPALGGGVSLACPYAWCLMLKGLLLCFMGHLEKSASHLDRALRVAQEQGDLEVQGWSHGHYVWLARYTGQTEAVLAHATQAHEIAERIGSPFSRVWSLCYLGYARLILGETGEAIVAFERSLDLARKARTGLQPEAWLAAGLSEALLSAGDHATALEVAEESVSLALKRGTEMYLPNCYRVVAEALLASEDPGRNLAARDALDKAAAAVDATGARAELPFIQHAREKLITVS